MDAKAVFTADQVAQIVAGTLTTVLGRMASPHTVDGVAVLPGGGGTFLIDLVMRDRSTGNTWGLSLPFPPEKQVEASGVE